MYKCISNGTVSTKRDNLDFDIDNFLILDADVLRCTSYGVYISQLVRFATASSFQALHLLTVNIAETHHAQC